MAKDTVYKTDTGAVFKRHANGVLELICPSDRIAPTPKTQQLTSEELASVIRELKQRLRRGVSTGGTPKVIVEEVEKCLLGLGMKPKDITRKVKNVLTRKVWGDAGELLTEVLKEV